ncbi:hypothetical protein ACK3SF_03975 [Candidatus Nanosalina sp. VS9-1]|uniref:hypothetical protein n=1 Tax=Candidatus Nanosalina sp. VS9-1 TaxID=3388566 RepID=UPI0039DFA62D
MEKLKRSVSSDFEEGLHGKDEEDWLNVNISMKPPLLNLIDEALEEQPFSSRSRLIRRWIRQKAKAEMAEDGDVEIEAVLDRAEEEDFDIEDFDDNSGDDDEA